MPFPSAVFVGRNANIHKQMLVPALFHWPSFSSSSGSWDQDLTSWMPTPGPCHHDGVITYLEPDILEFEVKWALGSITMNKASGGDDIPAELLLMLKVDAVKVLHSICQQIWKTQQWPQDRKRSVFIPIPKKNNAKACSNYRTIALISHASEVMLKILPKQFIDSMQSLSSYQWYSSQS